MTDDPRTVMHPPGGRHPGRPSDDAATAALQPAAPGSRLRADVVVERAGFALDVTVEVSPGEVLAVLGPNGAGKTTLLRALAGLLPITRGSIVLSGTHGDMVWDDPVAGVLVPAQDRGVGLLFQDYRLFPHLSVLDNVAFGVRAQGFRRRAARSAAAEWLLRVGLSELADRRPDSLSGGQSQRVALARALAASPRLLLLDEPLAALDARTRIDIRAELRQHLSEFDGPTLLVTHDPLEALVLADRIVVVESGRVVQEGSPSAVARRPATEYVARLMGLNLYTGVLVDPASHRIELDYGGALYAVGHQIAAEDPSQPVTPQTFAPGSTRMLVVVAPSAISIHTSEPAHASARNVWPAVITGIELLTDRVRVAVKGRPSALVDVTPAAVADLNLETGVRVWLSAKATEVVGYPEPGRAAPAIC
jgi:molybdate transport system ATP-binding protein